MKISGTALHINALGLDEYRRDMVRAMEVLLPRRLDPKYYRPPRIVWPEDFFVGLSVGDCQSISETLSDTGGRAAESGRLLREKFIAEMEEAK